MLRGAERARYGGARAALARYLAATAKGLHRAGLEEAHVSLDYADAARHDAQCGREGAWDRAVRALELLRKHSPRGHRVHIVTVLMHDNLDELEPLLRLARGLGASVYVTLYSPMRGRRPPVPEDAGLSARLLDLKRRYRELGSQTAYLERMAAAVGPRGVGGCCAGDVLLSVDPGGGVARCLDLRDERVGSILTGGIPVLARRLARVRVERPCPECRVACRGFAEAMSTPPRIRWLREYRHR